MACSIYIFLFILYYRLGYNITPQNSTLNRYGDQVYMKKVIRDASGCTDFVAIITYPDTTTQILIHYSYTYTINGKSDHCDRCH